MKRQRTLREDAELVVAGVLILGVVVVVSVQLMRVNGPEKPTVACTMIGCFPGLSLTVGEITSPTVSAVEVCVGTECQRRSRHEVNSHSGRGQKGFFLTLRTAKMNDDVC